MNQKTNKRVAALIVALSLALPLTAANAAMMEKPTAKMDMPMKEMGMPLRSTAEMNGYSVMWNQTDKSITLTYIGKMEQSMVDKPVIVLKVGSIHAMVGDKEVMLDAAPYLGMSMGATMVSQKFVDMYLSMM